MYLIVYTMAGRSFGVILTKQLLRREFSTINIRRTSPLLLDLIACPLSQVCISAVPHSSVINLISDVKKTVLQSPLSVEGGHMVCNELQVGTSEAIGIIVQKSSSLLDFLASVLVPSR